jgi:6-phosphogluconolactonase
VSPSGRHVYISNRGEDNIAVFAIDAATGKVTLVEQVLTGGKSPRNFTLDPNGRWLLAANQRSDSIVSFKVDPESGRLTPTGHQVELATPVCIKFR